jgi:hypothetical protein
VEVIGHLRFCLDYSAQIGVVTGAVTTAWAVRNHLWPAWYTPSAALLASAATYGTVWLVEQRLRGPDRPFSREFRGVIWRGISRPHPVLGRELVDLAPFCMKCGAQMDEIAKAAGGLVGPGHTALGGFYCLGCGHKVEAPGGAAFERDLAKRSLEATPRGGKTL